MKKLFTILSITLSMTVMSAPEDLLEKNDYLGFVSQYSLTQSNLVTEANYRQIYDAGMSVTNSYIRLRASQIASLAWVRDWDKTLICDAVSKANYYSDIDLMMRVKVEDGKALRNLTMNRADRNGMLQAYKTAYNRGKYEAVALCACDSFGNAWGIEWNKSYYPGFTEEWINLCRLTFTKDKVAQFTNPHAIFYAYIFWRHEDILAGDKNYTQLSAIWDDNQVIEMVSKVSPSFWWEMRDVPDVRLRKMAAKYSTRSAWRTDSAIWLDTYVKDPEWIEYVYNDTTKTLNWIDRYRLADKMKNADKLIDTLLLIDGNQDPKTLDKIIKNVISFDVDYRSADVTKILRTINAKYTIKLYDDRDTWEPIISKIRALIDARQ